MPVANPTMRGRRAVAFVGVVAASVAFSVSADARHYPGHATSHRESSSGPPYAAIVVDANSGAVLHAANADELRHPASLTKIMTLYLLFERLEAGKLRLDTPLAVSEHASEQSPTKLGLRPGQTIAVEDAIRGLVTKSANDAAVVIAEALGGTEREFAEMMTHKAHALGMSRTFYHNASGLPDDEQVTTARDQALLGRAIQERFPRYYPYFATPSFTYHGVAMRNHNHLLGQVQGLDGIKTGYTQASGFNLVTSVHRNNRHIVAVVLGGASAGARDARMRTLIEEYIVAAAVQKTTTALAEAAGARDGRGTEARATEARATEHAEQRLAARAEPAPAREARGAEIRAPEHAPATYTVASYSRPIPAQPAADPVPTATVAPAADKAPPASDPIQPIHVKTIKVRLPSSQIGAFAPPVSAPTGEERPAAQTSGMSPPRAPAEPAVTTAPRIGRTSTAPVVTIAEAKADFVREAALESQVERASVVLPQPARASSVTTAVVASRGGQISSPPNATHSGWIIQVGAFEVEREARQKLSDVKAKAAGVLGRADPFTEPVVKGDKTLYRARFAGLQKDQAEAVCRQLKRDDIDCMTVRN